MKDFFPPVVSPSAADRGVRGGETAGEKQTSVRLYTVKEVTEDTKTLNLVNLAFSFLLCCLKPTFPLFFFRPVAA